MNYIEVMQERAEERLKRRGYLRAETWVDGEALFDPRAGGRRTPLRVRVCASADERSLMVAMSLVEPERWAGLGLEVQLFEHAPWVVGDVVDKVFDFIDSTPHLPNEASE